MNFQDNYRSRPEIAWSDLKLAKDHPALLQASKQGILPERKETPVLRFGSMVDMHILTPDEFDKNYFPMDDKVVAPRHAKHQEFCTVLLADDRIDTKDRDVLEQAAIDVYKQVYVTDNKSDNKVREEALALLTQYFEYLVYECRRNGRIEVTPEDQAILKAIDVKLKKNPRALQLLGRYSGYHDASYYQKEIYWTLVRTLGGASKSIDCKSLVDHVGISHVRQEIDVVDLKTTSMPLVAIKRQIERYGYHKQLEFYSLAVDDMLRTAAAPYHDYKLRTHLVFVRTVPMFETMAVTIGDQIRLEALEEIEQLADNYIQHKASGDWEYPLGLGPEITLDSWDGENDSEMDGGESSNLNSEEDILNRYADE